MNIVKIYKYNTTTDAFDLDAVEKLISGSYNKAINEMGQINLSLQTNTVADVEDFIELFLGDERLATGYIAEINRTRDNTTVIALTEEYKLAKCIMPTEYTQNVTGLTLETLAKMISRRYWQVRWSDRLDFLDTSKMIAYDTNSVVKDSIGIELQRDTGNFEHFAYELTEYYQEKGTYKDLNTSMPYSADYDRVAILNIHPETFTTASAEVKDYSLASQVNPEDLLANDFSDLQFSLVNDVGTTILLHKNNNILFSPFDDKIVGFDIVGIEGTKIKLYLNSSGANFLDWEQYIIGSNYPINMGDEGMTLCKEPAINTASLRSSNAQGILNLTTGAYAGQKIERIRWSEPEIESFWEYTKNIKNARVECDATFMGNSFVFGYKNPNEFTERAGFYVEPYFLAHGGNASVVFGIVFPGLKNVLVDKEDALLVAENILNQEYVKAIEFILYQEHLDNFSVDAALQNLRPNQFEMNGNTNYDVLKQISDESLIRFRVEDDILYLAEKGTGTPQNFILHDGINADVSEVKISDEQLFNFRYLEGQGDGVLNKPFINVREDTKIKNTRKGLDIVRAEQKTKEELIAFSNVYGSALNKKTKQINVSTTYNQIETLVKTGDIIKAIHDGTVYDNVEVEEVTYDLSEDDAIISITAGKRNKKLN